MSADPRVRYFDSNVECEFMEDQIPQKSLLTKEEFAVLNNVSVVTLNRLIAKEIVSPVRVGKRMLIPASTIIPKREARMKKEVPCE